MSYEIFWLLMSLMVGGSLLGILVAGVAIQIHRRKFYEVRVHSREPLPKKVLNAYINEAHDTKRQIVRRFKALGYQDEDTGEAHIAFERAVITMDRFYLKIAIRKLPEGLRLSQLLSNANLLEVAVAVQRQISTYITPQSGAWLVVCRPGWEDKPESYQPYFDVYPSKNKWQWPTEDTSRLEVFSFDDELPEGIEPGSFSPEDMEDISRAIGRDLSPADMKRIQKIHEVQS